MRKKTVATGPCSLKSSSKSDNYNLMCVRVEMLRRTTTRACANRLQHHSVFKCETFDTCLSGESHSTRREVRCDMIRKRNGRGE